MKYYFSKKALVIDNVWVFNRWCFQITVLDFQKESPDKIEQVLIKKNKKEEKIIKNTKKKNANNIKILWITIIDSP